MTDCDDTAAQLQVDPSDVVQEGKNKGNSSSIVSLFEAETYAKTNDANINELYDKMSQSDYEQFLVHINFTEPYHLRDAIVNLGLKQDVKILDFGCGTGIVGYLLKDFGYTNIYGLDASEKFIKMINSNGIYKGGEALFLGQTSDGEGEDGEDKFPIKYHNEYDLVTGTGVFLAKHIPSTAFYDAYKALKLNGIFIFTLRSNLWVTKHELGYKDVIDTLVRDKKMEFIDTASKTFWRGKENGMIGSIFERQQSKLFALRKIA